MADTRLATDDGPGVKAAEDKSVLGANSRIGSEVIDEGGAVNDSGGVGGRVPGIFVRPPAV